MSLCIQPQRCRLRLGVARGDVTPPVGIYHRMWGAALHDRSTGIHQPLTATVLVMEPTGELLTTPPSPARKVLVALDHCLLWNAEMETLLRRVACGAGCDAREITVFFSHTHGAGLMGLERRELPGGELIPPYLEHLADQLARLVTEARGKLTPANIVLGRGRCDLAANRDLRDPDTGKFVCGFNPDQSVDDLVMVGRVTDDSDHILATIVNYACHPTTLAWENTLISPDYVGAMREVVEQATAAPCFFIQGASGDVGPREGFVGDVAVADRNGRRLGYAALAALAGLPPARSRFTYGGPVVSGATIGVWRYEPATEDDLAAAAVWRSAVCEVELPYRRDLPNREQLGEEQRRWRQAEDDARAAGDAARVRDARAMVERATRRLVRVAHLGEGDAYHYRAELWQIGDAVWVPLNGEHYNVLQRTLRAAFPERSLVIGTLANGSDVWYLPDADSYGRGLYQEEASILARGSLETLTAALERTLRFLAGRS